MPGQHIIDLLDGPTSALNERDRAIIEAHIADCSGCLLAFVAAGLATELLQVRANETAEPSPFFHSRLMTALRESQPRQRLSFVAMWKEGRALVGSMAALLVILLALTFYPAGFGGPGETVEVSSSENLYSAEWVILENGDASDDLTYSQVLETLYDSQNYAEHQ